MEADQLAFGLRPATHADLAAFAALRNSDDVRAVSKRRHALDPEEYERELLAALGDPDREIVTIVVDGRAAGYVRIDRRSEREFEIGVALDEQWRGRGLGTRAIADAARDFLATRPSITLVALIRPENERSVRAFTSAGFAHAADAGEFVLYRFVPVPAGSAGRAVCLVQARVGSSRFPGKVLADIEGAPLLARLLARLRRSTTLEEVAVATSTDPTDDAVERIAVATGTRVSRGPLTDVLERLRRAADALEADTVVRVTGDCPLVDPGIVDRVVRRFADAGVPYVSNVHPPTFPDGLDVECVAREALERAAVEAVTASEREHATLYLARHPDRFRHVNVTSATDLSAMRWTVDYPSDLRFVREVFARFPGRADTFSYADVVAEIGRDPGLRLLMQAHPRNEALASDRAG